MSGAQERDELHQLVDELTDEQVHGVLTTARRMQPTTVDVQQADAGLAWIGVITDGPVDLAERAKSILHNEMGQAQRPAT